MSKVGEAYIGSCEQRLFDVIAATSLGLATAPLLGISALALSIDQRSADVLFCQTRIGKNGEPFNIFKLRTIPVQNHSAQTELGGSEHPDASRLGKLIRKAGIDEIPQCGNVIIGDLHVVGVRAQIPVTLEQREDADPGLFADWSYWATKNPGIIGPGQAFAHRHAGTYTESSQLVRDVMHLDIAGCEKASLRNDFACLAATPLTMIRSALSLCKSFPEVVQADEPFTNAT